jgi:hypothetical protein
VQLEALAALRDGAPLHSEAATEAVWLRNAVARIAQLVEEVERLRSVCEIAAQTSDQIQEWLGHASTRQAAVDSLWRMARALQRAGFNTGPRRDNLDWRGSLLDELWEAGFYRGADGLMHLDPRRRLYGDAEGPTLREVVASLATMRERAEAAERRVRELEEALSSARDLRRSE